jgi:hypothetical protein
MAHKLADVAYPVLVISACTYPHHQTSTLEPTGLTVRIVRHESGIPASGLTHTTIGTLTASGPLFTVTRASLVARFLSDGHVVAATAPTVTALAKFPPWLGHTSMIPLACQPTSDSRSFDAVAPQQPWGTVFSPPSMHRFCTVTMAYLPVAPSQ